MRIRKELVALAIALAPLSGCAEGLPRHRHDATVHHRFDDAKRWERVFDDPARDAWQKPDVVMKFLGIAPGSAVADLGAGTGYFTVHLAHVVGSAGRVYAVDIEPSLIEHLTDRARRNGLSQVTALLAEPSDPRLPAGALDLIFVCDTWHHIDDRVSYLRRLAATLKPGGRVAIVDYRDGDLPVGPPRGHKLSREAVLEEFTQGGFALVAESKDLPYQYLLVFGKP